MSHFAFLVLLGLFIGTQAASFQDLLDALNTTEKSWLTKRTYTYNQHSCVYTLKEDLTETKYTFEQGYKKGDQVEKHTLYAKLGYDESTGPWMTVSNKPEGQGLKYVLEYWSGKEKCGILKAYLLGHYQYEVHQWDSKVDGGAPECMNKYQELSAGRQSYQVYYASCKSAARKN